jgi:hypothetical protein
MDGPPGTRGRLFATATPVPEGGDYVGTRKTIRPAEARGPAAAARRRAGGPHRGSGAHRRGGRPARRRGGAAGACQRRARGRVRRDPGPHRPVRPGHFARRRSAAMDRRGRAYRDGARQAGVPLRAGFAVRPPGPGGIGGDELARGPAPVRRRGHAGLAFVLGALAGAAALLAAAWLAASFAPGP